MKLTFWGAAGTVTGSMHLLETGGKRYPTGLRTVSGPPQGRRPKNRNLPFPGDSIDAVVLSHAHIDHSGNLPTPGEEWLHRPDLLDPGEHRSLQLDAARHRAHSGEGRRVRQQAPGKAQAAGSRKDDGDGLVEPLYTMADAERTLPLFQPVPYHEPFHLSRHLSYEAYDAGHILGSSCIALQRHLGRRRRCA